MKFELAHTVNYMLTQRSDFTAKWGNKIARIINDYTDLVSEAIKANSSLQPLEGYGRIVVIRTDTPSISPPKPFFARSARRSTDGIERPFRQPCLCFQ